MTKGEAMALETDMTVFPLNFGKKNEEVISAAETIEQIEAADETHKINIKLKFARLKKSLRKRSVSIL